jgi:hypothetical protein
MQQQAGVMCLGTIHDHVHIVAQVCHGSSENVQTDIVARVAQVREVIYSWTACRLISKLTASTLSQIRTAIPRNFGRLQRHEINLGPGQ